MSHLITWCLLPPPRHHTPVLMVHGYLPPPRHTTPPLWVVPTVRARGHYPPARTLPCPLPHPTLHPTPHTLHPTHTTLHPTHNTLHAPLPLLSPPRHLLRTPPHGGPLHWGGGCEGWRRARAFLVRTRRARTFLHPHPTLLLPRRPHPTTRVGGGWGWRRGARGAGRVRTHVRTHVHRNMLLDQLGELKEVAMMEPSAGLLARLDDLCHM